MDAPFDRPLQLTAAGVRSAATLHDTELVGLRAGQLSRDPLGRMSFTGARSGTTEQYLWQRFI